MKFAFSTFSLVTLLSLQACDVNLRRGGSGNSININVTTASLPTDRGVWIAEYQAEGDTLAFAVLSEPVSGSESTHGHLSYTASSDSPGLRDLSVRKPDGSGTLPVTYQLYQVTPHGVIFTDSRVSATAFEEFLQSRPTDFSISSLLAFAARRTTSKP